LRREPLVFVFFCPPRASRRFPGGGPPYRMHSLCADPRSRVFSYKANPPLRTLPSFETERFFPHALGKCTPLFGSRLSGSASHVLFPSKFRTRLVLTSSRRLYEFFYSGPLDPSCSPIPSCMNMIFALSRFLLPLSVDRISPHDVPPNTLTRGAFFHSPMFPRVQLVLHPSAAAVPLTGKQIQISQD